MKNGPEEYYPQNRKKKVLKTCKQTSQNIFKKDLPLNVLGMTTK